MPTNVASATAVDMFDRVRQSTDILVSAIERQSDWQSLRQMAIKLYTSAKENQSCPAATLDLLLDVITLSSERVENVSSFIAQHRQKHDRLMEVYNSA